MSDAWEFGWDELLSIANLIVVVGIAVLASGKFSEFVRTEKHRRKLNVAEETLTAVLKAPRIFAVIRDPISSSAESKNRPRNEDEDEDEETQRRRDIAYVPIARINFFKDFWDSIDEARPRVLAFFGEESERQLEEILKFRGEIFFAAGALYRAREQDAMRPRREIDQAEIDRRQRHEDAIWAADENDPISRRLDAAVTALKNTMLPLIRE